MSDIDPKAVLQEMRQVSAWIGVSSRISDANIMDTIDKWAEAFVAEIKAHAKTKGVLKQYVQHHVGCSAWDPSTTGYTYTCGLDKALAALEET